MYYLFYDGQQLQLVESELGAVLTVRLLLHAQVSAVDNEYYKVYGCVDPADIVWFMDTTPVQTRQLGFYVEPRIFTDDKDGRYWSLLTQEDAKRLLMHWKSFDKYTEKLVGKQNYFKNTVDHFENLMEKKWSKQTK